MGALLQEDQSRYRQMHEKMPAFQKYYRLSQECTFKPLQLVYRFLLRHSRKRSLVELMYTCHIGGGLYLGHPYCITINPNARIGANVSIHRGAVIGQENRGKRQGTPIIGDNVWIGINAAIVGNIHIGNDVPIAPNSYVNRDIPDHSVVFGNPCTVRHRDNATESYIIAANQQPQFK